MSDDLRTRIATTIYGDGEELAWARTIALADLIIWELGLKRADGPLRSTPVHRYITDWIPNG